MKRVPSNKKCNLFRVGINLFRLLYILFVFYKKLKHVQPINYIYSIYVYINTIGIIKCILR